MEGAYIERSRYHAPQGSSPWGTHTAVTGLEPKNRFDVGNGIATPERIGQVKEEYTISPHVGGGRGWRKEFAARSPSPEGFRLGTLV